MLKKCLNCGSVFRKNKYTSRADWVTRRFCSRVCVDNNHKSKIYEDKKCVQCGEVIRRFPGVYSDSKWAKRILCSHDCSRLYAVSHPNSGQFKVGRATWNKDVKVATNTGRTWFQRGGAHGKTPFCKGMSPWNKGMRNGRSSELKLLRSSNKFKEWRRKVFERDNFTCQKYKKRGAILHPHHILNFSSNEALRFDVNNGITLSAKAHKEFHKIYGVRDNTLNQVLEFIKK